MEKPVIPEARQQSRTAGDISFLVISTESHTGSGHVHQRPVWRVCSHRRSFARGLVSTDGLSAVVTDPRKPAQDLSVQTQAPGPRELMQTDMQKCAIISMRLPSSSLHMRPRKPLGLY